MFIQELWRYPVKSMKGERLDTADLGLDGIAGDRRAIVVSTRDRRIITSRTHPRLLAHQGSIAGGRPHVDGKPIADDAVASLIEDIAGDSARIIEWSGPERFDILPLLVATDGAIAALGVDHRRLRPNIVIGGVEGMAERSWERKTLQVGEAIVQLDDLRGRCVMTTFDPDTGQQQLSVLKRIIREFDGTFCLNASVVRGGRIRVGDAVELQFDDGR